MRARVRLRRWRSLLVYELHHTGLALTHYRHEAVHVMFIALLTFGHSIPGVVG